MRSIFPEIERAPTDTLSCRIPNEEHRSLLIRKSNGLCDYFRLPNRTPLRSAAVAYLGLCRMKDAHDKGNDAQMEALCLRHLEELRPDDSGKSINCATFSGTGKFRDHGTLIASATRFYLPTVKSAKKRGAVLLAVGCDFNDKETPLPADDVWIDTYLFRLS